MSGSQSTKGPAPTDAELDRLVDAARRRKMSPSEEREQKVAWVCGQLADVLETPPTLRQIREDLNIGGPSRK